MNNVSDTTESKPSWSRRIRRELLEYWMTVLYLGLYFGAFITYRRLILAEYHITYLHYGFAVIQALVLAKVILIGDMLRLGHGLEHKPLIIPTLAKTLVFTVWVAVFSILEHTIHGLLHGEGLTAGLHHLLGEGNYELLGSSMVVFFTFIPFFAFKELNRVLGTGRLWGTFFRRRAVGPFPPPRQAAGRPTWQPGSHQHRAT